MTIYNIKKSTRRSMINSGAFIFLTITSYAALSSQQADARAAAAAAAAAPAAAPAAAAPSNPSSAPTETDYQPLSTFISPDGHTVWAYDAIRSSTFCTQQYDGLKRKSNAQRFHFWTQCILGGKI